MIWKLEVLWEVTQSLEVAGACAMIRQKKNYI